MSSNNLISKTSTITLKGSLGQVFPLFGPIKEQEWAEGWQPRMLLAHSEDIEEHMVFQTDPYHNAEVGPYTWVVSKLDPANASIEYTVFADARLWWITIQCEELEGALTTAATITYTYVGLNEHGSMLNELALEAMYRHELKDWEKALNHYLETGTRLSHSH
jgi:hypothetical protein